MNASGDNELVNQGGDPLMHVGNVEFSDIEEPLVIEPVRTTRSQSRVKEPSQPPSDIEMKKKGRPRKAIAKPRRRRIVESDDENEDDWISQKYTQNTFALCDYFLSNLSSF